jgi:aspartyl-tRNA(Asn)/glutamyl-tRNA(Gln) amidotransferase subunit C
MKIDEKMVRRLAELSCIALGENEVAVLAKDLAQIVGSLGELEELDTAGVEPTYQVTGLSNVWREDVVEPQIPREQLLALAPEQKDNAVKVPKVL